jgi:SAM-dependent methyltransferase
MCLGLGVIAFMVWILWSERSGAPWVPTTRRKVGRMLELAEVGADDVVYDLGCGDGRLLLAAARERGARAVGVEIDPLRWLWCRARVAAAGLGDRVHVVRGDLFAQDLSEATVVVSYLLQDTSERLGRKLLQEAPGARVVSNVFTFPNLRLIRRDERARITVYAVEAGGRPPDAQ